MDSFADDLNEDVFIDAFEVKEMNELHFLRELRGKRLMRPQTRTWSRSDRGTAYGQRGGQRRRDRNRWHSLRNQQNVILGKIEELGNVTFPHLKKNGGKY